MKDASYSINFNLWTYNKGLELCISNRVKDHAFEELDLINLQIFCLLSEVYFFMSHLKQNRCLDFSLNV